MRNYELANYQTRIIITCLEERRDFVLTKFDKVRKMKAALNEELYNSIMQSHHLEIELINNTILSLTPEL